MRHDLELRVYRLGGSHNDPADFAEDNPLDADDEPMGSSIARTITMARPTGEFLSMERWSNHLSSIVSGYQNPTAAAGLVRAFSHRPAETSEMPGGQRFSRMERT